MQQTATTATPRGGLGGAPATANLPQRKQRNNGLKAFLGDWWGSTRMWKHSRSPAGASDGRALLHIQALLATRQRLVEAFLDSASTKTTSGWALPGLERTDPNQNCPTGQTGGWWFRAETAPSLSFHSKTPIKLEPLSQTGNSGSLPPLSSRLTSRPHLGRGSHGGHDLLVPQPASALPSGNLGPVMCVRLRPALRGRQTALGLLRFRELNGQKEVNKPLHVCDPPDTHGA